MGKTNAEQSPVQDKAIPGMDSKTLGSAFKEASNAQVSANSTAAQILKGADLAFLEDRPEAQDPLGEDTSKLDNKRYVLARLLVLPENQNNFLAGRVNGKKYTFRLDEWCVTPMMFVTAAKQSGQTGFRNEPRAQAKLMVPNHPRFEIKEIPEPLNQAGRIHEFLDHVRETKGISLPMASPEM